MGLHTEVFKHNWGGELGCFLCGKEFSQDTVNIVIIDDDVPGEIKYGRRVDGEDICPECVSAGPEAGAKKLLERVVEEREHAETCRAELIAKAEGLERTAERLRFASPWATREDLERGESEIHEERTAEK